MNARTYVESALERQARGWELTKTEQAVVELIRRWPNGHIPSHGGSQVAHALGIDKSAVTIAVASVRQHFGVTPPTDRIGARRVITFAEGYPHGTLSGYSKWCPEKCEPCRAAGREYRQTRKRERGW